MSLMVKEEEYLMMLLMIETLNSVEKGIYFK